MKRVYKTLTVTMLSVLGLSVGYNQVKAQVNYEEYANLEFKFVGYFTPDSFKEDSVPDEAKTHEHLSDTYTAVRYLNEEEKAKEDEQEIPTFYDMPSVQCHYKIDVDTSVNAEAVETYNNSDEQYILLQSTERVYQDNLGATDEAGEYHLNIAIPAKGQYIEEDETWSTIGTYSITKSTKKMRPKMSSNYYQPQLYEEKEPEEPLEPTVPKEEPDGVGITVSEPEKKVKVPPLEPVEQATVSQGMPTAVGTTSVLGTTLASIGGIYLVGKGKRED